MRKFSGMRAMTRTLTRAQTAAKGSDVPGALSAAEVARWDSN